MIERLKFGLTKEGKEASIYILENNNGMHVQVSDFGALILTIMFPCLILKWHLSIVKWSCCMRKNISGCGGIITFVITM